MSFFNNILFAKLAWSIYFNKSASSNSSYSTQNDFSQFATKLNNLILTTKISNHLMVHTLYYLYLLVNHKSSLQSNSTTYSSFTSSSREKLISGLKRKNSTELFELMVTLLMVANKSHDDSSYTMKTWENLTDMTVPMLKKREIIILKKISYNVFLKDEQYNLWYKQLHSLALKFGLIMDNKPKAKSPVPKSHSKSCSINIPQMINHHQTPLHFMNSYPLTPKSPIIDLNGCSIISPCSTESHLRTSSKRFLDNNDDYYSPNPLKKLKQQSVSPMPLNSNSNSNQQSYLLTPIKSIAHYPPQSSSVAPLLSTFNTGFIEPAILPPPQQQIQPFVQDIFNSQSIDTSNNNHDNLTLTQHPKDCSCCALTNMANSYYSSIRNTMVKL